MSEMAGLKNISKLIAAAFIVLSLNEIFSSTAVYVYRGTIESVRKDSIITINTTDSINDSEYYIIENGKKVAEFSIMSMNSAEEKISIIAEIKILNPGFTVRAGQEIGFVTVNVTSKLEYPDYLRKDETSYRQSIISKTDSREMVLINKGKTQIGSSSSVNDEYPRHEVYLDDYYMDKYEVSNSDYLKFIKTTGKKIPASWKSISFAEKYPDLPVLVSYHEAEAYAGWAGKRLPTENEWEKGASGNKTFRQVKVSDGYYELLETTRFPWGDEVKTVNSNCREYWAQKNLKPSLLPVKSFEKESISAFGAVNMSGNAPEWTQSWYDSYPGNHLKNRLFGKKVKVVKGGGWFDSIVNQTIQKRAYGGVPNLDDDIMTGFRCIKVPDYDDVIKTDYSLSR